MINLIIIESLFWRNQIILGAIPVNWVSWGRSKYLRWNTLFIKKKKQRGWKSSFGGKLPKSNLEREGDLGCLWADPPRRRALPCSFVPWEQLARKNSAKPKSRTKRKHLLKTLFLQCQKMLEKKIFACKIVKMQDFEKSPITG